MSRLCKRSGFCIKNEHYKKGGSSLIFSSEKKRALQDKWALQIKTLHKNQALQEKPALQEKRVPAQKMRFIKKADTS